MDNLYIIISFHCITSVYDGQNHIPLYNMSFNNKQINIDHFNEINKILNFKVDEYNYKNYTYNTYFEFKSIIKIINEILKRREYNIASISEDINNTIKYHLVKSNVKQLN